MTDEYTYIQSLYEQAMENRSLKEKELQGHIEEEMEKHFWQYASVRLQKLVEKVMMMHQSGKFTPVQMNEAETRVSSMISMVNMYTLPEVIVMLTKDLVKKNAFEKVEGRPLERTR